MAGIGVVTDSAASLPAEVAARHGIRVVPMQIIVDGEPFLEGVDITPDQVIAHLEAGRDVTTSQPSSEAFLEAIRSEAAAGARAVVVVTLSSELSGTYASAVAASTAAGLDVEVVDSRTVAMAQGLAAVAAARASAAGGTLAQVAAAARWTAERSTCLFTVETLDHLRRGGRIGPAVAAAGRVLGIRPVLAVEDGRIVPRSRARSGARARTAIAHEVGAVLASARGLGAPVGLAVLHAGAHWELDVDDSDVDLAVDGPVSAVLAAHTGPGTVAAMVAPLATLDAPPG
ncbi:DegV family protein [Demequina lignilytica]|uniref:DegV family protein n=1 Tax=Demequina lignilytica TaxID=3051663 RepID=A0AB35MF46_9MICO|nr:DegV family protein [Demequina sp. SYSU T0a273]MDN4482391.1 DegV family protein [Demequina sp. SYSU T0a273]